MGSIDTLHLNVANPDHLYTAAALIRGASVIAFPFNGIWGLFADIDRPEAVELIFAAKGRLQQQKLPIVCLPEDIHEIVDFGQCAFPKDSLVSLWANVHALGAVLPASSSVPAHLVTWNPHGPTVLAIWTEYPPLRQMMVHFRALGGLALVATSANKSGDGTHWRFTELWDEFKGSIHAAVQADFETLAPLRRRSTSIVDFTMEPPRLLRVGNVTEQDLAHVLECHGFGQLQLGEVKPVVVRPVADCATDPGLRPTRRTPG